MRPPRSAPSWRALHRGCSTPLVRPQRDGLAVGPGCSAPVLFRGVPQALSQNRIVLVARLHGEPGMLVCSLTMIPLTHPTILTRPLVLPLLLVKYFVQVPSERVRRAVEAAPVRCRQLSLDALVAHRMLLPLVVHI